MTQTDTVDLYAVFGVPRDATAATIKKAYHRLCLQYHPDKLSVLSTDEQRQEAAGTFQRITHYHAVLADTDRRARYDSSGFVGTVGGSDEDNGLAFEAPPQGWTAFFKELWGSLVTEGSINAFALKYRGSNDEKEDVIKFYLSSTGSMQTVLDSVPLCSYEDESRFRQIVQESIDAGSVTATHESFFVEDKRATERRRKEAEKEAKAVLKAEAARKKKEAAAAVKAAKASSSETSDAAKKGDTKRAKKGEEAPEDLESLRDVIKKRAQERMGGLVERWEAKANAEISGKRGKRGAKGGAASSAMEVEPSEEEFLALQAKMFKGTTAKAASTSKKPISKKSVEEEEDWSDAEEEVDELEDESEEPVKKGKRARRV
ncbi:DnaJ sub C member 9 [Podochytrium sp. JEL0797]|nr:DnaJ sub C member 9 [Podochytrium sp. JEL0797]